MIFLTGGSGLLGLHILDELQSRGIPVRALVRDDNGASVVSGRGAVPVLGRVEDPATWAAVAECEGIIHGAALIAGRFAWERYLEVNVEGARLAAERARQLGVPLVHISSVAVYGPSYRGGEVIEESHPFGPLTSKDKYARSKRMAEEAVWKEARLGLRAVAIRPCVVYGEGDRLFLPRIVRSLSRSRLVPLIGDGDRPLSLVHSRNVAQAVVLALTTPAAWGQPYNVANDDVITARGFVAAVGRALGREIPTIKLPAGPMLALARMLDRLKRLLGPSRYPGSIGSAVRYWRGGNPYSSDKARRDLGWSRTIRHEQGIENAVRSFMASTAGRQDGNP